MMTTNAGTAEPARDLWYPCGIEHPSARLVDPPVVVDLVVRPAVDDVPSVRAQKIVGEAEVNGADLVQPGQLVGGQDS